MARRRVIDYKKLRAFLRKRGWKLRRRQRLLGWPVALTWLGILACADDFGMGSWSVTDVATAFMEKELDVGEISLNEVAEIMDSFRQGHDPSVITWEHEDQTVFVLPKYQNYQNIHSPQNADTPFPPRQIFAKLTPRMQRHFCKNFAKFTSFTDPRFHPEVEVEVEVEGEEEGAGPRKPVCSWCANPTDPDGDKPEPQRLAQVYHDAYREAHGDCPSIGNAEFGAIRAKLAEGKSFTRVAAVIRHGVTSQDQWLRERGHALVHLLSKANFQGIAQALDEGRVHGGKAPANVAPDVASRSEDVAESWRV